MGDTFVQQDRTTSYQPADNSGTPYLVTSHTHTEVTIMGREDITTHAGLFKDCIKTRAITQETEISVRNGVSTSSSSPVATQITWYAPGAL